MTSHVNNTVTTKWSSNFKRSVFDKITSFCPPTLQLNTDLCLTGYITSTDFCNTNISVNHCNRRTDNQKHHRFRTRLTVYLKNSTIKNVTISPFYVKSLSPTYFPLQRISCACTWHYLTAFKYPQFWGKEQWPVENYWKDTLQL